MALGELRCAEGRLSTWPTSSFKSWRRYILSDESNPCILSKTDNVQKAQGRWEPQGWHGLRKYRRSLDENAQTRLCCESSCRRRLAQNLERWEVVYEINLIEQAVIFYYLDLAAQGRAFYKAVKSGAVDAFIQIEKILKFAGVDDMVIGGKRSVADLMILNLWIFVHDPRVNVHGYFNENWWEKFHIRNSFLSAQQVCKLSNGWCKMPRSKKLSQRLDKFGTFLIKNLIKSIIS